MTLATDKTYDKAQKIARRLAAQGQKVCVARRRGLPYPGQHDKEWAIVTTDDKSGEWHLGDQELAEETP